MNILAVIPARGGSKGIPRKNIRIINNKPLIFYVINNAKLCSQITDIVVSSDDDEIIEISKNYGVDTIKRDAGLAKDITTLDPVVFDAVIKMEERKNKKYDIVITLQPTSPLLKSETLEKALNDFIKSKYDTYISVTNNPHLSWGQSKKGFYPLYKKRVNRQQLPPNYIETGAFFITKRQFVKDNTRMGKNISVYEIPIEESTDIDTVNDWIICENQLKKKNIIFRVDGHKTIGMGHIYRCITLAHHLIFHNITFVTKQKCAEGLKKIQESKFKYRIIKNDDSFFNFLKSHKTDIVVNDCLDTTAEYILKLKKFAERVISFEDLGSGIDAADAVINSLYENSYKRDNVFSGEKYICLKEEFLLEAPVAVSEKVKNVLVLFGGTDPSNLTRKIYRLALEVTKSNKEITFTFLIPLSYDHKKNNILNTHNIKVISHVNRVSTYMKKADIAFTSQGRTVFELACLGIPSIVLAQNQREQLHTFANMENGFLNLGLGKEVPYETIKSTFDLLISTNKVRQNMHNLMIKHDLKSGINRVKNIILGE